MLQNHHKKAIKSIAILALMHGLSANATCVVKNSDDSVAGPKHDAFYHAVEGLEACPQDVIDFREALLKQGFELKPAIVANRGRLNPSEGSFSFFETASKNGTVEMYFGHFSVLNNGEIHLDQSPDEGKLLIELIAWDGVKEVFNFYELRGLGQIAQWFFRGDSLDILSDNRFLYRERPVGAPAFGARLRCSACHISGGPIMKEITPPHNDWWQNLRPLILAPNKPSFLVQNLFDIAIDAQTFSRQVVEGIERLSQSPTYQQSLASSSLQEQLRPLFCDTEINLESAGDPQMCIEHFQIPTAFFINPLLIPKNLFVKFLISQADYQTLLDHFKMEFPEGGLQDADHAWLVPVKGISDHRAIQELLDRGLIDLPFVQAVLSVDMSTPLLSEDRCKLLKWLPPEYSPGWQNEFVRSLKRSPDPAAQELARMLNEPLDPRQIVSYVEDVQSKLLSKAGREFYFTKLIKARAHVFDSEISQNPRGQILEPGFRVIFPISKFIADHLSAHPEHRR